MGSWFPLQFLPAPRRLVLSSFKLSEPAASPTSEQNVEASPLPFIPSYSDMGLYDFWGYLIGVLFVMYKVV